MRRICAALCAAWVWLTPARALDQAAMADKTPVGKCSELPVNAVSLALSRKDGEAVCASMMRALDDVRNRDVYVETVVVAILANDNYLEGNATAIADKMNTILQLRGFSDAPDRWEKTEDIMIRAWQAFYGNVTLDDAIDFLTAAGRDVAHGLSDDGFRTMIAVINRRKKDK